MSSGGNHQVAPERKYGPFLILLENNPRYTSSNDALLVREALPIASESLEGACPMRSAWGCLMRGLGLFIVLSSLASAGCASAPVAPVTTMTPPPVRVASSSWESLSLPLSGTPLLFSTVSPRDPATIYACTSTPSTPGTSGSAVPILLWRTQDAGHHWAQLLPPPFWERAACCLSPPINPSASPIW